MIERAAAIGAVLMVAMAAAAVLKRLRPDSDGLTLAGVPAAGLFPGGDKQGSQ